MEPHNSLRRKGNPGRQPRAQPRAPGTASGLARRLWRNDSGFALLTVALLAVPLVGFIGIATDAARAYMVKSRLSSALDAAALAGGWAFNADTRDADITQFFEANFPDGFLNATVTPLVPVIDPSARTVTVSATATVQTIFMGLLGFDTISVEATAQVTRQLSALDVVLAIDVSGSMDSSAAGSESKSRLEAAVDAAEDMMTTLFGEDATKAYLNVGLVPWSSKVNVMLEGETFDDEDSTSETVPAYVDPTTGLTRTEVWYANNSPVPLFTQPPSNWQGCVFNRFTDDALDNDADILMGAASVGGAEWPAWELIGPEGEPTPAWWTTCDMSPGWSECNRCPNNGITPLTGTKQTILDALDDLDANGATNIPAGLAWAWEVLSPAEPFDQAVESPDYPRTQAIVLLTDGENHGGYGDGYKTVWGTGSYQPDMDDRLELLAANIKADGVVIYTIQFANGSGDLGLLMQNVASGSGSPYYHYAPDSDTLTQVFQEIANHLSQLHLSK